MADDAALQELLDELAKTRGADFRGYKTASLQRRLRKRMAQLNLTGYQEYLEHVRSNDDEINQLVSVVLINVTEFFRDPPAWDALRQKALPRLLESLEPGQSFRAWCAGCATGEEVYSLAILLAEHFGPRLKEYDIKIYATDHDEDALNTARRAEYSAERIHGPARAPSAGQGPQRRRGSQGRSGPVGEPLPGEERPVRATDRRL